MTETARFIRHAPCDACGSSDALAVYSDGGTHCFKCQAHSNGGTGEEPAPTRRKRVAGLIQEGLEYIPLTTRGISQETCRHFGYATTNLKGKPVHVAPYFDAEGQLVAQKIRTADKKFSVRGDISKALPFGSQCWQKTGKKIVVTEGEIDCLSMSQVQGNRWPVVSIPSGAPSAKKHVAENLAYYRGFDEVVLMMDMDTEGRKAAEACAAVLGARARIAELPGYKDPNEMLVDGAVKELTEAMWRAKEWRPEGIVELSSLKDAVMATPEWGIPWWTEKLTKLTYGIRLGEIYAFGAGTGVGKTDFFMQELADLVQRGHRAGVFALEQLPAETVKRLAGKVVHKPLHIPDGGWTKQDLEEAWAKLEAGGKVFLYDSFGANSWESIKDKLEYLVHAADVRFFFLDHLTALAAAVEDEDERKALDAIMADMGALVKRLGCTIFLVSHLARPDKGSHEEGARVTSRQFRGSNAIGMWAHFMFGLERNTQADDLEERQTTTFRVLKDRYTGRANGATFPLGYDHESGMLFEKSEMFSGSETSDF